MIDLLTAILFIPLHELTNLQNIFLPEPHLECWLEFYFPCL